MKTELLIQLDGLARRAEQHVFVLVRFSAGLVA